MESPAERKAVEQANPILKDMAAQTTDAIRFLNENTNNLFLPEYRQHLQRISHDAEQLRTLFRESTKLNALSRKAEHLREDLNHS
jgi:transcriptional accessory protein Tex/SPT6